MLQIAPEGKADVDTEDSLGDEIYCAGCGHTITRTAWKISRNGEHEHVVFNPAGVVFRVVCFKEAPGVGSHGTPSDEFTWFKGYAWQVSHCQGCSAHIGWQFTGESDVFFGLIKPKLTTQKREAP